MILYELLTKMSTWSSSLDCWLHWPCNHLTMVFWGKTILSANMMENNFPSRTCIFPSQMFDTIYPLTDLAILPRSSKFLTVGTSWLHSYRILNMTLDYLWTVQSVTSSIGNQWRHQRSSWGPTAIIWIALYPPRCRSYRKLGPKMRTWEEKIGVLSIIKVRQNISSC